MITKNSKIKDVYENPIGSDIIDRLLLQIGKSQALVTNPIVGNVKLKTIDKILSKKGSDGFVDTFINMLNIEKDVPGKKDGELTEKWWKEAVFYQIYPRTFMDSNNDGMGDLRGITSKLDYLKDLGVDCLWLSPIYESPQDDNGYDISDYYNIWSRLGTMEDFDELLSEAHKRGIKLIMDLVVNHTSDEHEWFKKALEDENSPYRDYYFFRKGDKDTPPNNWKSFFSGSAWNYYEKEDIWALHLFSKKQMDLNWENPELRADVIKMINFWLDKGVDGFRMDVINYISKENLENGDKMLGDVIGFTGIEHYFYGPRLHEFLHEINTKAFKPHNSFSVGETPGLGRNMARLVTGEERGELDMVFSFDHLETPGHVRFDDYRYDLNYLRDYYIDWITNYGNNCWMSLFYDNHDNPRMVSKVNPDPLYRKALATLLAAIQMTMKGTPFIFQGDEMGLTNYNFKSMDDIEDVESKGEYNDLINAGKSPEEAFSVILAGTRDHARRLLPWNGKRDIPDYLWQEADESVTEVYKEIIKLRHGNKALVYGELTVLNRKKDRFTYVREYKGESFLIDCNLSSHPTKAAKYSDFILFSSGLDGAVLGSYGVVICKL